MNNFSPSTDTSVGTKRFTAQEVQLAYTLMAVEYMKTVYLKVRRKLSVRRFLTLWLRNKTQNSKVSLWKNWLKNSKHLIDYGL